jgi:N-acetylglucosamine-6-sulfatase
MRATGPVLSPVRLLALLSLVLALSTAVNLTAPDAARGQVPRPRPNIVVIMTDDQTVAELSSMPNTQRLLGGQGVSFRRAYVSYPVCCPSRATYLTGQYAHNHHVMGLYPPTGGYGRFDKRNALPVWLQRAGYYTAHLGKFLNGYGDQEPADVPPGWSDWHATVDYSTYRMWGYTMNNNGRFHTYGSPFDENPRLYQTDVLTDQALSVVQRRAGRQPFFLSINFLAPHHEDLGIQRRRGQLVRPAPRHRGAFASLQLARTASFNERDMSDKPRFLRRRTRPLTRADLARLTRDARSRRASLLAVDDAVGRIVAALRQRDQLDNTYIVFTSDNGYMQGEHRVRSGKMLPYEPSAQVPLLIRGPGLPAGQVSSELVANVDLAPTMLDIADAEAGKTVDGRSLLPFARHPYWRSRRAILHETGGRKYASLRDQDERGGGGVLKPVVSYRAVRTPGWLYVRWRGGDRELYDLKRDSNQMRSLHDDPRYRPTRHVLARELRRLAHCRGHACRRATPHIPRPR